MSKPQRSILIRAGLTRLWKQNVSTKPQNYAISNFSYFQLLVFLENFFWKNFLIRIIDLKLVQIQWADKLVIYAILLPYRSIAYKTFKLLKPLHRTVKRLLNNRVFELIQHSRNGSYRQLLNTKLRYMLFMRLAAHIIPGKHLASVGTRYETSSACGYAGYQIKSSLSPWKRRAIIALNSSAFIGQNNYCPRNPQKSIACFVTVLQRLRKKPQSLSQSRRLSFSNSRSNGKQSLLSRFSVRPILKHARNVRFNLCFSSQRSVSNVDLRVKANINKWCQHMTKRNVRDQVISKVESAASSNLLRETNAFLFTINKRKNRILGFFQKVYLKNKMSTLLLVSSYNTPFSRSLKSTSPSLSSSSRVTYNRLRLLSPMSFPRSWQQPRGQRPRSLSRPRGLVRVAGGSRVNLIRGQMFNQNFKDKESRFSWWRREFYGKVCQNTNVFLSKQLSQPLNRESHVLQKILWRFFHGKRKTAFDSGNSVKEQKLLKVLSSKLALNKLKVLRKLDSRQSRLFNYEVIAARRRLCRRLHYLNAMSSISSSPASTIKIERSSIPRSSVAWIVKATSTSLKPLMFFLCKQRSEIKRTVTRIILRQRGVRQQFAKLASNQKQNQSGKGWVSNRNISSLRNKSRFGKPTRVSYKASLDTNRSLQQAKVDVKPNKNHGRVWRDKQRGQSPGSLIIERVKSALPARPTETTPSAPTLARSKVHKSNTIARVGVTSSKTYKRKANWNYKTNSAHAWASPTLSFRASSSALPTYVKVFPKNHNNNKFGLFSGKSTTQALLAIKFTIRALVNKHTIPTTKGVKFLLPPTVLKKLAFSHVGTADSTSADRWQTTARHTSRRNDLKKQRGRSPRVGKAHATWVSLTSLSSNLKKKHWWRKWCSNGKTSNIFKRFNAQSWQLNKISLSNKNFDSIANRFDQLFYLRDLSSTSRLRTLTNTKSNSASSSTKSQALETRHSSFQVVAKRIIKKLVLLPLRQAIQTFWVKQSQLGGYILENFSDISIRLILVDPMKNFFDFYNKRFLFFHSSRKVPDSLIQSQSEKFVVNTVNLVNFCVRFPKLNFARILAEHIALEIERDKRHWPFLSLLKNIFKTLYVKHEIKIYGLKIGIYGKIRGSERKRSHVFYIQQKAVPMQQLERSVDYSLAPANTVYGTLGVKVWVFY